jgi:hypothetical protein
MDIKRKQLEKATIAESDLRTATIYEMIIKGCNKNYIVRFCAENYNIKLRQVEVYIAKATAEIKENYGEKYKEQIIEKHLAQLDDLYIKNYTIEDFRECRNLIESKNKMLGLNAPIKTDVTSNGKDIIYKPLWAKLDSVFENDKANDSE